MGLAKLRNDPGLVSKIYSRRRGLHIIFGRDLSTIFQNTELYKKRRAVYTKFGEQGEAGWSAGRANFFSCRDRSGDKERK